MSLKRLYSGLSDIGLPVAYRSFIQETAPPFIVYALEDSNDILADNDHFLSQDNGFVELYTDIKDVEIEAEVKSVFNTLKLPWGKEMETYLPDQRMFMVRWSIQIIGE